MLAIVTALLPLVNNLTPIVITLISHIKAQSGMTTEEIFKTAKVTLDENNRKLIADLERLGV